MKKILMVGPVPPPFGGIATVMDSIIKSDLAKDYSFDIFERASSIPEQFSGFLSRNIYRMRRFLQFFFRLCKKRCSFVHIQSADPAFMGTIIFMILCKSAKTKILLHMHGTDWDDFYAPMSPMKKAITRFGLRLPDKIVVLYSLWERKIKEIQPRADICVMRNLVHPCEIPDAAAVEGLKSEMGLRPTDFVVLTVGSVGRRKGSFEILRAAKLLSRDNDLRFILIGGEEKPGEMEKLKNLHQELGLGERVIFLGEVDSERIPIYLALAEVFLLPSFIEGMPMSIIEAMRSGLPVISTRVGGIPDIIDNGISGLLIDPGKPEQIAESVNRLKADAAFREQISARSRMVFAEKFEFSRGIGELRNLYSIM